MHKHRLQANFVSRRLDQPRTAQGRGRLPLEPHPLQGSAGGAQRLSCRNVCHQLDELATAQARTRLGLATARERTCRGLRSPWVVYTRLDSFRFLLG